MEKINKKENKLQEHITKEKESEGRFNIFVEKQTYLREMASIMEAIDSIKQSNIINEANEEIKSSYKELIQDIFNKLETKFVSIEKYDELKEELRKTNEENEIAKEVIENTKKKVDEKLQGFIAEKNPNWHEAQGESARALGQLIKNQELLPTQKAILREYTERKFKEVKDMLDPKDDNKRYNEIHNN